MCFTGFSTGWKGPFCKVFCRIDCSLLISDWRQNSDSLWVLLLNSLKVLLWREVAGGSRTGVLEGSWEILFFHMASYLVILYMYLTLRWLGSRIQLKLTPVCWKFKWTQNKYREVIIKSRYTMTFFQVKLKVWTYIIKTYPNNKLFKWAKVNGSVMSQSYLLLLYNLYLLIVFSSICHKSIQ